MDHDHNVPSHKIQKVCKHDVLLTRKLLQLHPRFAHGRFSENKNLTFTCSFYAKECTTADFIQL